MVLSSLVLGGNQLEIKASYILYSQDHKYIYACGGVEAKVEGRRIRADYFYYSIRAKEGQATGAVEFNGKKYDILVFKLSKKFKWMGINFGKKIEKTGDRLSLPTLKSPDELRKAAVFFEAHRITVGKYGKVKGWDVQPYVLGAPSIPLSSFVLDPGSPPPKTNLRLGTLRFTREDGAMVGLVLDLKEKIYRGRYETRYFERELFKLSGEPRGIIFSGYGSLGRKGRTPWMENSLFYTTEGKYLDFSLYSRREGKLFLFVMQNRVSSRQSEKPYYWLSSSLRFKKYRWFQPEISLGWDYKSSYQVSLATYINPHPSLHMDLSWMKNQQVTSYTTTSTSTSSFHVSYNPSIFNFSASALLSKDLLEKTKRKDISLNLNFRPLSLLQESLWAGFQFFFMFSSFPYGKDYYEKLSPGMRVSLTSSGYSLPLGLIFLPTLDINQTWERGKTSWTEFNYFLSFQKEMGNFILALEINGNSRYKLQQLWVEGTSNVFINGRVRWRTAHSSASAVFYFDRSMSLERINIRGDISLFWELSFRFFSLYNQRLRKITIFEGYIEKNLRGAIKVQLGYSLSHKKYFVRVIPL